MSAKPTPSRELLLQLLRYDESNGNLIWKKRDRMRSWNKLYAGKRAGYKSRSSGKIIVTIHGESFRAHRVIWKMIYGEEPVIIDHKSCFGHDNSRSNLRRASSAQNTWNRGRLPGKKLPKWVFINKSESGRKRRFISRLIIKSKIYNLGRFMTPEEAHSAACKVAKKHHGSFLDPIRLSARGSWFALRHDVPVT